METLQLPWATCTSAQSPSQQKKSFLMFRGNLSCFFVYLWPLVLALGATEKILALGSLHPFIYIGKIPPQPSLLLAE